MTIPVSVSLPDGGDAILPFTIARWSSNLHYGRNIEWEFGATDIFDYWGIQKIENLGIISKISEADEQKEYGYDDLVTILIDDPVFLAQTSEFTERASLLKNEI